MTNAQQRPSFGTAIYYREPVAALEWLEKAFGFERYMVITDSDGILVHSELRSGADGYVMIGAEWADWTRSPKSIAGTNTQSVHIQIEQDIDAHCARARAAGASVLQEPEDQFYGDRTYRAVDPEGHVWTFAQAVRDVSREEAERASGLTIEGWA